MINKRWISISLVLVVGVNYGWVNAINPDSSGTTMSDLIANKTKNVSGNGSPKLLSRRKRYIAFPEGSSFSVAFCATIGMIGNPNVDYLSWALNWGLAYDLPNETWIVEHRNEKFPKPLVQRRHRRDLYNRLELAIDKMWNVQWALVFDFALDTNLTFLFSMGYNGRECIFRALCESAQYFVGKGTNMVEELIRVVFTLPDTRVLSFEHNDLHGYDNAHRMGRDNVHCTAAYRDCSISLIELALGRYSKPYNFM